MRREAIVNINTTDFPSKQEDLKDNGIRWAASTLVMLFHPVFYVRFQTIAQTGMPRS